MMNSLPFDVSQPAVQQYLALIRLQVLTPLSLLINIAVVVICTIVAKPTLSQVAHLHQTSISPRPSIIAVYVFVIYVGQIGYCFLLVLASKAETKQTLTKAVGISLVLANWVMPLWAITVVFEWFLFATVLQGLLLLCLLYANIALLIYHPPTSERPFDTALIHAPLRFFLALPLNILFPYCLFVTLGMSFKQTEPGSPAHYSTWHAWSGFVVVFTTNLLALVVVLVRRDVVWCVAATWLCVSVWAESPKPPPVFVTVIMFTVLHPLALIVSEVYAQLYGESSERGVALPAGDNRLYGREGAAREVDAEATWG